MFADDVMSVTVFIEEADLITKKKFKTAKEERLGLNTRKCVYMTRGKKDMKK